MKKRLSRILAAFLFVSMIAGSMPAGVVSAAETAGVQTAAEMADLPEGETADPASDEVGAQENVPEGSGDAGSSAG